MFFAFLIGAALIAVGIGALSGGGWATAGAVVLVVIGAKLLLMGLMFGFFGRRFRTMRRAGWSSEDGSGRGPWPCGRHRGSDAMRARMEAWHEMAHAGADSDTGSRDDDVTAE
jgi:hypothetical protein